MSTGASNAQKSPLARTLNAFAERKAAGAISIEGKALPAKVVAVSGSIVTVAFLLAKTQNCPYTLPNVTVPLVGPEYARAPTQVGDLGVVFPADAYLGGVSGLGGGVADLSIRANLSSLVFFPIGNKSWSASEDPNSFVLYGPDGVIIRRTDKAASVTVSANGVAIKVQAGKTVTLSTLPTVSTGLASGALWNNLGVVNIIP